MKSKNKTHAQLKFNSHRGYGNCRCPVGFLQFKTGLKLPNKRRIPIPLKQRLSPRVQCIGAMQVKMAQQPGQR